MPVQLSLDVELPEPDVEAQPDIADAVLRAYATRLQKDAQKK